jgi:hypothetical protein
MPWTAGLAVSVATAMTVLGATTHSQADERRANQLTFANVQALVQPRPATSRFAAAIAAGRSAT